MDSVKNYGEFLRFTINIKKEPKADFLCILEILDSSYVFEVYYISTKWENENKSQES